MARSLDQILAESNPYWAPSQNSVQTQIDALPGQTAAQLSGLTATADQANQGILDQARQRGLGFSGIPIAEQTKYNATAYMPAVAKLQGDQLNRKTSLQDTLAGYKRDQFNAANGIQQNEVQNDQRAQQLAEQARQFNADMAFKKSSLAASSGGFGSFGGGGGAPSGPGLPSLADMYNQPSMSQRGDKGYNFTIGGKSVSAATYSQKMGIPIRDVLSEMASKGDAGARSALGYVGNDYGYNPNQVGNNQGTINLLNNLLWGVTNVKSYSAPKAASAIKPGAYNPNTIPGWGR